MDNIFDRITAIKYEFEYLNNDILILKKICSILKIFDHLSINDIKKYLLDYNNFIGLNITNQQIINTVNSHRIPIITTFQLNIPIHPPQPIEEDIPIVLKDCELDKLEYCLYDNLDNNLKIKNKKCMIKLIDFEKDDIVRILPCKHIFSKNEIDEWLLNISYKCPICRIKCGESMPKI
tara:strand:+ start:245 stop:778 length:534 start_codon:yes stop_codon:yes gene_type:complete